MITSTERFLRFFLIALFLSHELRVSASFFQFAFEHLCYLNEAVTRILVPSPLRIDDVRVDGPRRQQQDEEFSVIIGNLGSAFLISEKSYEEIIEEIKDLRSKLLSVGKSGVLKYELLQKIYDLFDDQTEKYEGPRKQHFTTLNLLIRARCNSEYIPNSLFKAYLQYVSSKILAPNVEKEEETRDGAFAVIHFMIRYANNPEYIEILLKNVAFHLNLRQRLFLFEACHGMFREYAYSEHKIPREKRSKAIERPYSIYLLLLKYFDLGKNSFERLKGKFITPSSFIAFIDVVLPFYRALLLKEPRYGQQEFPAINYKGSNSDQMIRVLDFFIKKSDFNNNFMVPESTLETKRQLFRKISFAFFQDADLLTVLHFCIENGLKHLYEAELIFTEKGADFTSIVLNLIEIFIKAGRMKISYFASLLAHCPDMTVESLDANVRDWASEYKTDIFLDSPMIKGLKRFIKALESLDSNSRQWEMSPGYLALVQSDSHNPKDMDLLQLGRIYLLRYHGVPFCRTVIHDDISEDADWVEMIGFINFILERESKRLDFSNVQSQIIYRLS